MKVTITENSFPKHANVAHAEAGDKCEWRRDRDCWRLIRISDNKSVFSTATVNKDGFCQNGTKPNLVGVIAEVKKYNWRKCVTQE